MYSSDTPKRRGKVIFSVLLRLTEMVTMLYINHDLFISYIIYKMLCI